MNTHFFPLSQSQSQFYINSSHFCIASNPNLTYLNYSIYFYTHEYWDNAKYQHWLKFNQYQYSGEHCSLDRRQFLPIEWVTSTFTQNRTAWLARETVSWFKISMIVNRYQTTHSINPCPSDIFYTISSISRLQYQHQPYTFTHTFIKTQRKKWRLYRATRRRQRYRIAVLIQGQLISLAEMEAVICFLREG